MLGVFNKVFVFLIVIVSNITCGQEPFSESVRFNFPIIVNDSIDNIIIYQTHELTYMNEDDLYVKLDSLVTQVYGDNNVSFKMVYKRLLDSENNDVIIIERVKILKDNNSITRITLK